MGTTDDRRQVDEKGRVTIPKDMRESLGIEPGEEVSVELRDDEVVIRPHVAREDAIELLEGCITEETALEGADCVDPMDPLGVDDPLGHLE